MLDCNGLGQEEQLEYFQLLGSAKISPRMGSRSRRNAESRPNSSVK